jgi:hypothetical protein
VMMTTEQEEIEAMLKREGQHSSSKNLNAPRGGPVIDANNRAVRIKDSSKHQS